MSRCTSEGQSQQSVIDVGRSAIPRQHQWPHDARDHEDDGDPGNDVAAEWLDARIALACIAQHPQQHARLSDPCQGAYDRQRIREEKEQGEISAPGPVPTALHDTPTSRERNEGEERPQNGQHVHSSSCMRRGATACSQTRRRTPISAMESMLPTPIRRDTCEPPAAL